MGEDYYFEGRRVAAEVQGGKKEKMRIFILCLSIRSEKVRERIKLPSSYIPKNTGVEHVPHGELIIFILGNKW